MKNKGFTLIEIMATLIILSIVLIITTAIVRPIINNSKDKAYGESVKTIERAAQRYVLDNDMALPTTNGAQITVSLSWLTVYIDNLKDPRDGTTIDGTVYVTKQDKEFIYQFVRQ